MSVQLILENKYFEFNIFRKINLSNTKNLKLKDVHFLVPLQGAQTSGGS